MTLREILTVGFFKAVVARAFRWGRFHEAGESRQAPSCKRRRCQQVGRLSSGRSCDRARRPLLRSVLFYGDTRSLSIVPRRRAALEALEARQMLTSPPPAWVDVSSGTTVEGGWITYTVSSGNFVPSTLSYGASNGTANTNDFDYVQNAGPGPTNTTFTKVIRTLQDAGTSGGVTSESFTFGASGTGGSGTGTGTILEDDAQHRFCTCNCGCGNVEPSVDPATGAAMVGDGRGDFPGALGYNGYQRPHPIVDVVDTLSSTVASATNIETQLTLQDLSGNTVWTGTPVYYSPSGYTQGQQVEFAGQIDATGLADGTYERVMTVTENYASSPPVIRTYANWVGIQNRDNSPYGSGWAPHNVDKLVIQPGNLASGASLEDGSGNVYWFEQDENGNYVPPGDSPQFVSLVKNGDGTYTLTKNDHGTEQFSSTGLLTKSTDRQGNWLQYMYNGDNTIASVQDEVGRTTSFTYSGGHVSSVTDFAGRTTSYVFTNGQLTQITRPAPGNGEAQPVTTLGYDSTTGLLTTITDSDGTTTLSYNKWRAVTKIVGPDNTSTQYNTPASQAIVDTSSGVGTQSNPAPLVYASSIVGSTTDGNNHTSSYTVDPTSGDILSSSDAAGNTVSYQVNSAHEITQITQPPLATGGQNLVTVLKYDNYGNLIERDLPDGSKETWTYNTTFSEPTVYVDPAGRETDYTLDSTTGNVLTVTQVSKTQGLANLVTTLTYTPVPTGSQPPAGLVATVTDPRGIVTAYSYTHHGQVSQIVYAQGTSDQATVSMTYDANDNPASYTNELNATTLTTYDNLDRLVKNTLPAPNPSQPNVQPVYTQVWDARGRKIQSTDALNLTTSYAYALGSDGDDPKLTKLTQPDPAGGSNYTVTTFGYDNADNKISILDPLQRLTSMGYSANNLQTSLTLPNPVGGGSGGPQSTAVYNGLGMPVQEFDAAGNETDNTFNYLGEVLATTGPAPTQGAQRPTITYTYNADGQVTSIQDAMGHLTQRFYDDFGRLIKEILPDPDGSGPLTSPILQWSYDPDGNVVGFIDANNNSYSFSYNNRNMRTQEVEPSPDGVAPQPTWQWQYDKANELTQTTDPLGRVYQQQFNADGWLVATIAPNLSTGGAGDATTTTTIGYNLDGVRTSGTTPNGATTTWKLDDLNRVIEMDQPVLGTGYTAPVWKYTLNADGETTQVLDPIGRTQTDTFDGMGRMTGDVSFTGVNTAWAYNNLSEVTSVTVGTGSSAETTTNNWDALGRKTKVQDALSGTTQMAYDLDGFMTSLTDSDSNVTTWTRDNLERVTAEKNQLGYSRSYVWDAASNLTQETDRLGRVRNFSINHLNQTTAEQWIQGSNVVNTISTGYNADGEVTNAGDSSSSYTLAYDGQGHLASVDNNGTPGVPHVVLTSQYDGQGDRTSLSATVAGVKDFLNSYSYDTLSRMTGIQQQGQSGGNTVAPKSLYFGYNGIGEITTIDRADYVGMGPYPTPDPADSTLSYNTLGQLTGITPEHSGTNIDPLSWTYNALGLPATFTTSDGTATYAYDKNNQVTSVTYTGTNQPANESYTLDANGNRTNNGFQAGTNNQLTTDGTFNYQYDQEGNRTVRRRISNSYATDYKTTYAWDYRNRLTDVDFYDNNNVLKKHVHYAYDVFDHLIERDLDSTGSGSYNYIEYFVYDGESLAFVFVDPDGAGPQPVALSERVVDGPGIAGAHDAVFAEVCNCDGDTNDNSLPLDLSSDLGQTLVEVIGNGPTMDPQTMIQRPVGDGAGSGGVGGGGPGGGIDGFAGGGGGTDGGTRDTNDAGCNCGSSVPVFANGAASFQILAYETVTSLSSPGSVTWALLDNQNTVRDIIDVNGNVVDHLVYNSFGLLVHETSPGVFHVLGYAGGIYDPDAGLINFWHRWYDPVVGRWISEDPAGFGAGDPNLVRYVANNVASLTDSSGLDWLDNAANFCAGFGDSLSFGATDWIREKTGINGGINHSGGYYIAGEAVEIGGEIIVTGGGAALRHTATKVGGKVIRREANKAVGNIIRHGGIGRGAGQQIHHVNTLVGHPAIKGGRGAVQSRFPIGGLSPWIANGRWNLRAVDKTKHAYLHWRAFAAEQALYYGASAPLTVLRGASNCGRSTAQDNGPPTDALPTPGAQEE